MASLETRFSLRIGSRYRAARIVAYGALSLSGIALCMWILSCILYVAYASEDRDSEWGAGVSHGAIWVWYRRPDPFFLPPATREWKAGRYRSSMSVVLMPSISTGPGQLNVDVPLWVPLLASAALALLCWRKPRECPRHCSVCGYDLRGADHQVCPECGTPIAKTETSSSRVAKLSQIDEP